MTPPPKIARPSPDSSFRDGAIQMADDMERLAAWMYQTAQEIERLARDAGDQGARGADGM